jgi:NCS1 family nucleobase:cation symporter-1
MSEKIRQRITKIQEGAKAKRKPSGWILPKQKASFGEEDDW